MTFSDSGLAFSMSPWWVFCLSCPTYFWRLSAIALQQMLCLLSYANCEAKPRAFQHLFVARFNNLNEFNDICNFLIYVYMFRSKEKYFKTFHAWDDITNIYNTAWNLKLIYLSSKVWMVRTSSKPSESDGNVKASCPVWLTANTLRNSMK